MPRTAPPAHPRLSLLTAAALPLAGWALHSSVLSARLAAARRDPLTGLLTREGFERAAAHVLDRPNAVVLFVDLDDFKDVNDVFGHAAGDAALVHTARTLTTWTGNRGAVGRLGGDEFTAALTCHPAQLATHLDRLSAALHDAPHHGAPLPTTASIGAVHVADLPAPSLAGAIGAADAALYASKGAGRDRLSVPGFSGPRVPDSSGPTCRAVFEPKDAPGAGVFSPPSNAQVGPAEPGTVGPLEAGTDNRWTLAGPQHVHPGTAHRWNRTRPAMTSEGGLR